MQYLYERRYTIEGVQKLFKEKGVKNIVGDEIQKDFFLEAPQTVEINSQTREMLVNLQEELASLKQELAQVLKAAK